MAFIRAKLGLHVLQKTYTMQKLTVLSYLRPAPEFYMVYRWALI